MGEPINVKIEASEENPKVCEVDARVIAHIIMRKAHAREKPAIAAANLIIDYLARAIGANVSARN